MTATMGRTPYPLSMEEKARGEELCNNPLRKGLAFGEGVSNNQMFFEKLDPKGPSHSCSQMSGNPVKIGDGYATVTGDRLPEPLDQSGKAGARFEPEVRISVLLCSS